MAQKVDEAAAFVVRVRNPGNENFIDRFNNVPYVVPANGESVVPIDGAKLWFGDWEKRNKDANLRERDEEVARLKVRWGVYDAPLPPCPLEVFTLLGESITTILDDPTGDSLDPVFSGDEEKQRLAGMMKQYQHQLAALQEQMSRVTHGSMALEDVPEDEAEGVPLPPLPGQLDVPPIEGERKVGRPARRSRP